MTDSNRLERLEDELTRALVQNARLAVAVEHLSLSVTSLTVTVNGLRDAMNKGRGALWVIVGVSSVAGAVLASAISKVFERGS